MGTLAIIRRLWLYANWPNHPLVRRELYLTSPWLKYAVWLKRWYNRVLRFGLVVLLVAIVLELVQAHPSTSILMTLILTFMPLAGIVLLAVFAVLLVGWLVPLALAGGTAILRERTSFTWELLLTTPIPHGELLLSKLAVGLSRLHSFITLAGLAQIVPLIALLGVVARYYEVHSLSSGLSALLLLVIAILFAVERVQQFALASLLGLVAALVADTWAFGMIGAAALSGLFWLLHTAAAFVLVFVVAGEWAFDPGQAIIVGFPALTFSAQTPILGVALLIAVVMAQEWLVRRVFAWLIGHMSALRDSR